MKVLKNAQVKNFRINVEMYTEKELNDLLNKNIIDVMEFSENPYYCIYAEDCKTIQVEYNKEYGFYTTTVTTNTNENIYIDI